MNLDKTKWNSEEVYNDKSDRLSEIMDEYQVQAGILSTNMAILIELRSLNNFKRNHKCEKGKALMSGKNTILMFFVALASWAVGFYVCQ